ncbi:MAG TPA: hypothetical protein VL361_15860 [Candidatus Limnocylindrales bacterium]|jgi:hypothetical protein|nr:hypothetical protein [Candidatus Limnocylindrales bacterium]
MNEKACPLHKAVDRHLRHLLLAISNLTLALGAFGQGIPEPGLVVYGAISNSNGSLPVSGAAVEWRSSQGSNVVTNGATGVVVNGQAFYVVRIPFETRSFADLPAFPPSPNTFELTAASTTYTRFATVNGTMATVLGPTNFTFGAADRGRVERLDLLVNLPGETFTQWLVSHGLQSNTDPNADPLGKGMTYYQQYIAGTDPLDPNSVFKFIRIQPGQPSGIVIQWDSVAGKSYNVLRATRDPVSFSLVASNLAATAGVTSFQDPLATGSGPYFYRLEVAQP